MICKTCGKEFSEDWRKPETVKRTNTPCEYCSRSCSNKRKPTEKQKELASKHLKETYKQIEKQGRVCEKCGQIFHSKDMSRKQCFDCLPKTIKRVKIKKERTLKDFTELSSRTVCKILKRLNLPCSCCGFYVKNIVLDIHHIIPRKYNGSNDLSNLTYICPNCHRIAHNDVSLLPGKLISIKDQLEARGQNWRDYYYVK